MYCSLLIGREKNVGATRGGGAFRGGCCQGWADTVDSSGSAAEIVHTPLVRSGIIGICAVYQSLFSMSEGKSLNTT